MSSTSVEETTTALVDPIGLVFEKKHKRSKKHAAPTAAAPAPSSPLTADDAFMRRRRALDLWSAARHLEVALRTVENVECTGRLVAADAAQESLIVEGLTTPMGTYPSACVRTSDMLSVSLGGAWRLSCPLPPRPTWLDAEPPVPPTSPAAHAAAEATTPAGDGGEPSAAGAAVPSGARIPGDVPAPLEKYFVQRYMLFSRYDEGVALDEEGWYSVTPEVLARHMAERCRCDMLIDAFCGVGGNAIQFAYTCERVVAVDLDEARLSLARRNAAVYGVDDRVEWLHTDFFTLSPDRVHADVRATPMRAAPMRAAPMRAAPMRAAPMRSAPMRAAPVRSARAAAGPSAHPPALCGVAVSTSWQVVFLSPPWGGPEYASVEWFDLKTMMGGLDGAAILRHALALAPSVAYFLPKNTHVAQICELARENHVTLEIERCSLNGHEKGLMAYFGFGEEDE
jgi:trimethylguanosine synthase